MTVLPDSADLAADRDGMARGRRRGLGAGFWAAMIFAAACLMAAAMVAIVFGVFGRHAATPTPARPQSAQFTAAPITPSAPAPAAVGAPLSADMPPTAQVNALDDRVRRLETAEARTLDAAASMLAASALSDAAAGPHPFVNELAAIERLMPGSSHVQALATLAAQGAPTRAALAAELGDIAARVSVAAHTPAQDAGFMAQLAYAVSRVVSIRRVDTVGPGPDAVLARAQRRAADGDLEGTLSMLDTLPAAARGELGDWRAGAQRRVDIDAHVAALRAQALTDLAVVAGSPS
jgi:hypothetical protein